MGGASSAGEVAYRLNYEVSPITLVGGIAGGIPGGALGIVNLLLGASFGGLIAPSNVGGAGLDTFGVTFMPLQGSTVIDNQIATYPFANTIVAANAIINQPLGVSMLMRIPATVLIGGHSGRAAIFQSMQATLAQHIANEGTFVVNTPMYPWTDCILTRLSDVSGGESKQTQIEWKWEFTIPLISLDLSSYSLNTAAGDMSSGGTTDGSATGTGPVTGNPETVSSAPAVPNNAGSPGAGLGPAGSGGAGFGPYDLGGGAIGG